MNRAKDWNREKFNILPLDMQAALCYLKKGRKTVPKTAGAGEPA